MKKSCLLQVLLIVFAILRRVAWDYGRIALVTRQEEKWVDSFCCCGHFVCCCVCLSVHCEIRNVCSRIFRTSFNIWDLCCPKLAPSTYLKIFIIWLKLMAVLNLVSVEHKSTKLWLPRKSLILQYYLCSSLCKYFNITVIKKL